MSLAAIDEDGENVPLLGPTGDILLQAGERRRLDFSIVRPAGAPDQTLRLLLRDGGGQTLVDADARLIAAPPVSGDSHAR